MESLPQLYGGTEEITSIKYGKGPWNTSTLFSPNEKMNLNCNFSPNMNEEEKGELNSEGEEEGGFEGLRQQLSKSTFFFAIIEI